MPLLESISVGIATIATAQTMGLLPQFGDIVGNLLADPISGMSGRVVGALRGDVNHDVEKLLAATLVEAVDHVHVSRMEGGFRQIYWRDTQKKDLASVRSTAESIVMNAENRPAVEELQRALLAGDRGQVEETIQSLLKPLVDLNRQENWPVVAVDVAREFFGKFNEKYKSNEHVKGRLAFELFATRFLHREVAMIRAGHAELADELERILPKIERQLDDCRRAGQASPLGDYDVRFDGIIDSLGRLRDDVAEGFRNTHEGQRRLQEDVTAIHGKMDSLQGNRRLVASNLPPIRGVAPRLQKQKEVENALVGCDQRPRIAVLHGLGGYGKSTLGLLHATSAVARDRYGDRSWIVSCENRKLVDLLAGLLVPTADTVSLTVLERAEIVRTVLQEQPSLLVLDNVIDDTQWHEFLTSGLLNCPSLDVIVTCRDSLKRAVGGGVPVDRLASAEIRDLLGSRRPEICSSAHSESLATIERETEGMALLVAAVAAIIDDDEVDIDDYAQSLKAMPLAALPAADEDGLPYPKRADEILADFHRRLSPSLVRIAEYASLMPPARIDRGWLEWLLQHDAGDAVAADHRIILGTNKAGHPRKPSALVDEAIRIDLLRVADATHFQFHRLHRKQVTGAFRLGGASGHVDSVHRLVAQLWQQASSENDKHRFDHEIVLWDEIVTLLEGLRAAFSEAQQAWPIELRNGLAAAYVNRGNSRQSQSRYADADGDYGQAIEIMEGLRAAFSEAQQAWPIALQNDLAGAYMNRGVSRQSQGRYADADGDYGQAIELTEGIRSILTAIHAWSESYRSILALACSGRAATRRALGDDEGGAADERRAKDVKASDDSGRPSADGGNGSD